MPKSKIDIAALTKKYEKPSKFLKWSIGDNRIRLLSDPYEYYVVGKQMAGKFVRQVVEEGVEINKYLRDVEPKHVYGFVVFSHNTGHFHVVETGPALGVPLVQLMQEKYPEEYKALDIIVNAKGERFDRVYTAKYADKSEPLPAGVTKDSPEFKYILSYFEGLK